MENNLMPKIAEMLGVKLGECVIIERVDEPANFWGVKLTDEGLKFDEDFYKGYMKRVPCVPDYIKPSQFLIEEEAVLNDWLCGKYRVRESFPKDGDRAYVFSNGDLICGNRLPRIEEFVFDSKSQFHLLLKEKGLMHETVEEAIKCFEKDYNMFKEMQEESKN